MLKADVIKYYGKQAEIVRVLGVSKSFVSQWEDIIPEKYALLLDKLTEGDLRYDPAAYGRDMAAESITNERA